jgi:neurofibromin 1
MIEYLCVSFKFIAVLKLLVEHAQVPMEETLSININTTLLALASFIARFNNFTSQRIKIKFCSLCDSVCDHADSLTLRKDTNTRHKTLDIVMDWIKNPSTVCHVS